MMYVWITHYGGKFKDSEQNSEQNSGFEVLDVRVHYKGVFEVI